MPVIDSYPNKTPGVAAEFVYSEGGQVYNATTDQITEVIDGNIPTSDEKASFPAGASGADPLALASDPRFPTTDEKASFPAGASALVPLVLTNDPRIGDVNNFYGILVTDPSPLPINGTWIRQTTREVAFSPDGEMVYVAGTTASPSIIPAFPGAQGYGTSTPGGSGRHLATPTTTVYRVNTIADNNDAPVAVGDGTYRCSFRAAVGAEGPRVVVFEVSGRIDLASMITITEPYLTIAGQTAPAPGITLYGNGFKINTHDVVIQHIRSRANYNDPDQVEGPMLLVGSDVSNVVIDHCSLGWAPDENVTFWASAGTSVRDNTISNCIIHESLVTGNPGQDGYGMIFGKNNPATIGPISALRNLMISNKTRNPLYKGGASAIFANNVVYNAALGAFVLFSDDYEGGAARATVTKNVFKDGPSGSPGGFLWFSADSIDDGSTIYVGSGGPSSADTDNVYKTTAGAVASFPLLEGGSAVPPAGYWVGTPDDAVWISGISLIDPASLETSVLSSAGARPAERGGAGEDANDARLIAEYQTGTGAIPSTGYFFPDPTIANNSASFSLPADPDTVQLSGYTALEETLHTLAATVEGVDPPTYQTAYVPSVTTTTPRVVATLSALRNIAPTSGAAVNVLGYYAAGDGGGGPVRVGKTGEAPGTYVDNGGSIIVPTGGDGSAAWVWVEGFSRPNINWFGGFAGSDCTVPFAAAKNYLNSTGGDTQVLYFPGDENTYNIEPISFTNSDRQFILEGDSLRASRIKIVGAGTYGIEYGADSNSWGGLRNIRIESTETLTSTLYVKNPSNAFVLENYFLHGGGAANHNIIIEGVSGVNFTSHWGYTTGAILTNFKHLNLTSEQIIVYAEGNNDTGDTGILLVEHESASGGSSVFIGCRFEHVNAKHLFQFNTQVASWLRIISCAFINTSGDSTPAASIVWKASGKARPTWYLDPRFQILPSTIYTDAGSAGNNIGATAKDLNNPILDNGYIHFGSHRYWTDSNGRLRKFSGGSATPSSDTSGLGLSPRVISPTYGTSITIDTQLADTFRITPTDGVGFTISAPTNGYTGGQKITIHIINTFGVIGAITWAGSYKLAAWTNPANGFRRAITFQYDGSSVWHEVSRTSADIPN